MVVPGSFTESEHKQLADFINFVFVNAKWELSSKDVFEFAKSYQNAVAILKKIESHIFEVKGVTQAPKDAKDSKKST